MMLEQRIQMAATKVSLRDPNRDSAYWRTQTYEARLTAVEEIHQSYHR